MEPGLFMTQVGSEIGIDAIPISIPWFKYQFQNQFILIPGGLKPRHYIVATNQQSLECQMIIKTIRFPFFHVLEFHTKMIFFLVLI